MQSSSGKPRSRAWIWIVAILVVIVLCCCAITGGGLIYLRSQGQTLQGLLTDSAQPPLPQEVTVQVMPEATLPVEPPAPTPIIPTQPSPESAASQLIVAASSGMWLFNETSGNLVQVSYDTLETYWEPQAGLSPDRQFFAYISGFGGASINPALMIVNLQDQSIKLRQELTGPFSQPAMDAEICEPAFEATRAMQFSGSLAWSPDGQTLAFVGAMEGDTADVYLYHRADDSITRLSDEPGHASDLNWSPDGRWIEYVSVDCFGTGAGFAMSGLWAAEPQTQQSVLLEVLDSSGEEFISWADEDTFLIRSWGPACEAYNLRAVNVPSTNQQLLVDGCFSGAAYNPAHGDGLLVVNQFNEEFCSCGDTLKTGLYTYGVDSPLTKVDEFDAYRVDYLPIADLYALYGPQGMQAILTPDGSTLPVRPEVLGFKPYPSPNGQYWAWGSDSSMKSGLWVTQETASPISLSPQISGEPVWSQDGQSLYYIEADRVYQASGPQFRAELILEGLGEIQALIK